MTQYIYLSIGASLLFLSGLRPIYAQCVPDSTFVVENIIDPLPETPDSTHLGIADTACVNTDYATTFTFAAPDSIEILGVTRFVDSILVVGDGINGLPAGLSANCNPTSCSFLPSQLGCIGIEGVAASGTEGMYNLTISVSIYLDGSFFGIPYTLPDGNLVEGEYILNVREEGSLACVPNSVVEGTSAGLSLSMAPNPARAFTDLALHSRRNTQAQVRLINAAGQEVVQQSWHLNEGENRLRIDTSGLPAGLYTAVVTDSREGVSLRLLIH